MKTMVRQKRRDGLKRQAEIMAVALDLFSVNGYHATSVEEIINRAGIAKGTFYLHFSGKSDILKMIIESHLGMIYSSVKVLDISMNKPVNEMKKMYYDVTDLLIGIPEFKKFIRLMLRDAISIDRTIQARVNSFFDQIIIMSSDYIKKAQDEGRVVLGLDPSVLALSIVGSIKEMLYRWAVQEDDFNVRSSVETLVELYFRGMLV
ncbi:MAG TPA: TetR/AcrR family transcriptional regulator [Spirochaetota bacterium]|nr:TetR/AcrR family transcriptional regulator [Spirochaetota bacterium]HPI88632.1 TetR/AcrR family transcriptional regulator [Spirochaetota bacterium]HPR48273.1 TetR/AcrR family transcriptional regulator [Spirochaetota bacterium]